MLLGEKMDRLEIISVLTELHKITGFRVSLHGTDFLEIASYPEDSHPFCKRVKEFPGENARCLECDRLACMQAVEQKSTYIYKCRYGLTEAVSPLYNFGTLSGFLMMGQIVESSEEAESAVRLFKTISGEDIPHGAATLPTVEHEKIESYVKIMTICAQYLTLSNAVESRKLTVAEEAKRYIVQNLDKKFTISDICSQLGCSKSTLLSTFKKKYAITVNTYVTESRLAMAEKLLSKDGKSICDVALECGFSDQSYFSKVFSSRYGIPPSEYRHKSDFTNFNEE